MDRSTRAKLAGAANRRRAANKKSSKNGARGGFEPPTRGFSVRIGTGACGFISPQLISQPIAIAGNVLDPQSEETYFHFDPPHVISALADPHWTPEGYEMAATPLNARMLETLKPPHDGRIELTDGAVPGLKFRLTSNGVATWSLQVRVNGEKRRFTLGEYPTVGLAKARDDARQLREDARKGRDPIREARDARRRVEVERATMTTVADAIDLYAGIHLAPNLKTAGERERQLRAALGPHLARPIGELSRTDLQKAIDAKAAEGRLGAANRVRAALVHFAKWCWQRGHLPEHIGASTTRAAKEAPRDRVLSLDEVRRVYEATYELGPLWGPLFRLRILTAQRLSDIAQARWAEIDVDSRRYAIPASRTKNGRPHIVHLSPSVLAEFEALRPLTGSTPFVFTTTGATPVSGLGKPTARLYALADVPDWRPHDFRTAFASALCEAGESEAIVDRILNHSASGSAPSAVARVYNRAANLPQRAVALDRWAEMVTGELGVVVPFERNAEGRHE